MFNKKMINCFKRNNMTKILGLKSLNILKGGINGSNILSDNKIDINRLHTDQKNIKLDNILNKKFGTFTKIKNIKLNNKINNIHNIISKNNPFGGSGKSKTTIFKKTKSKKGKVRIF